MIALDKWFDVIFWAARSNRNEVKERRKKKKKTAKHFGNKSTILHNRHFAFDFVHFYRRRYDDVISDKLITV